VAAQHVARRLQVAEQVDGLAQQGFAGRGQPRRIGRTVDQIDARPRLQCLDAAGERRLRDMPQLGRAGEAARLRQAHEVFKPFGFHGAGV